MEAINCFITDQFYFYKILLQLHIWFPIVNFGANLPFCFRLLICVVKTLLFVKINETRGKVF